MRKLAALAVFAPSLALASGYALPNTNPRDLGVSASAVAAQNDAGGAYTLPASLARLDGWSARLSAGGVSLFTDWTDPTNGFGGPAGASGSASISNSPTALGNVFLAYGGKLEGLGNRGWGVGAGIQPWGGSVVTWPNDWAGRYRILEVNRQVFTGAITAAIEVIPRVRIGGGFVYFYTTETLKQNAWMAPFAGATPADIANPGTWNPALPDATGKIDASGGAASYDVSAEIQPLADVPLNIAVDYKHKATQTLKGTAKWQNLTPLAAGLGAAGAAPFADMDASQELTIPNRFEAAASYRVSQPLLVMATYTFERWSVYKNDVFHGANGASISVPRDYSNGWTLRGGAEYDLDKTWTVRGGLQYDHSGLDPKFYSPTLPDASSWAVSVGGTVRFAHGLSLDAGVFYAWMNQVKAQDPNPTTPGTGIEPGLPPATPAPNPAPEGTFRGTYNTNALIFGLSLGWMPGAK